jgi:hypothetical protein
MVQPNRETIVLAQREISVASPIRRPPVQVEERAEHSSRFGRHVSDYLTKLVREVDAEPLTAAEGGRASAVDTVETELSPNVSRRYFDAWARAELTRPMQPLLVTLHPGERVIGPPYDVYWFGTSTMSGEMYASGDRVEPDLLSAMLLIDGTWVRGAGIFLDAAVALSVAVTPVGSYEFEWSQPLVANFNLRCRGGLGVVVYEVGDDTPLVVRQAIVLNVVGAYAWTTNKGSGSIAEAVASMTDFGPVRLAPVLFNMRPGKRYLFWVWAWVTLSGAGSGGFLNSFRARVPLIVTSAGPPGHIR